MEKYFEKNIVVGAELCDMHELLMDSAKVAAANLFFHGVYADDERSEKRSRSNIALSCFNVIAVCEAIIETYAKDESGEALEKTRSAFTGGDELRNRLIEIVVEKMLEL